MHLVDVAGLLAPRAYFAIVVVTRMRDAATIRRWETAALAILLAIEAVATTLTLAAGDHPPTAWSMPARLAVVGVVVAACAAAGGFVSRRRVVRDALRRPLVRCLRRVVVRVRRRRAPLIEILKLCVALALLLAGTGPRGADEA